MHPVFMNISCYIFLQLQIVYTVLFSNCYFSTLFNYVCAFLSWPWFMISCCLLYAFYIVMCCCETSGLDTGCVGYCLFDFT